MQDAEASTEAAAGSLRGPASRRLAFRELGLALGMHAIEPLAEYADVRRLRRYTGLASEIEDFWLSPASQSAATWSDHRDINVVTLAACLAPDGALG